jgi:hypothetical protein
MGIIGFLIGAALVTLLRWLIGMEQIWDAQLALIGGGFTAAFFFMWGIGALNSRLSEHHVHEPPADADDSVLALPPEEHHDEAYEKPTVILGSQIWLVTFWTIVVVLSAAAVAFIPGWLGMTTSSDPNAQATSIGTFEVELLGQTLMMDQLTLFIVVVAVIILGLTVIAGGLGLVFSKLAQSVSEAKAMQPVPLSQYSLTGRTPAAALAGGGSAGELTAGELTAGAEESAPVEQPAASKSLLGRIPKWVWFVVLTAVLYPVFYYVAIGLILPNPQLPGLTAIVADPKIQLAILSLVNALLIAFVIVYPVAVLRIVGLAAGWLAGVLRSLPRWLGYK